MGTTRSSAADHYALKTDRKLWEHLQKFTVPTLEEGVARLRYVVVFIYSFLPCARLSLMFGIGFCLWTSSPSLYLNLRTCASYLHVLPRRLYIQTETAGWIY